MEGDTSRPDIADLQIITIDWSEMTTQELGNQFTRALKTFGLTVDKLSPSGDWFEYVIYEDSLEGDVTGTIEMAVSAYEKIHQAGPDDEEEYGLEFPWKEVSADWKLDPYIIKDFQRAAGYFGVQVYILPNDKKIRQVLLTRHHLTSGQLEYMIENPSNPQSIQD